MTLTEAVVALREPRFAWYLAARTTTTIGSAMTTVALAFAVLHISNEPGALARVLAAHTTTMVIFLLLGGVVADRYSRTAIMQSSHALAFLTQGTAAYLVLTGTAQVWHLVALEALNGAVSAFGMPAGMGVVPLLVPPERIQQANALLSFSRSTVTVIGPALAGALVVGAGPGWALLADALLFLVAIPMLMKVHVPGRVRDGAVGAQSTMLADLREGWTEFASRTWVWVIVGAFGALNAVHVGAVFVLGPVIAKSTSVGEQGWGLALSAEAAGTVLVTVVLLRARLTRPLVVGMLAVTTLALPIAVLGLAPRTDLLVLAFFVAGAGVETFGVGWSTSLHQHIPEAVLSRVSSYDALGSFVAMPVGAMVYGWLTTVVDHRSLLLASALLYVALALATLASQSVRELRQVNAPGEATEPAEQGA